MSSDREEKWKKYFSSDPVDTKIKAKPGEKVTIYNEAGKPIDALEDGHPIHVPLTKSYNQRYTIVYTHGSTSKIGLVNQSYVAKPAPTKGATESLGIRAETLTYGGETKTLIFAGNKVRVRYFSNHRVLADSLLSGLKSNRNVSERITDVFEKYVKDEDYTKIEWTSEVADSEINELGKYVGEIIIGLLALNGKTSPLSTKFYTGNPVGFAVPDDPSFAGVDSFLIMNDGEIIPISSKYGKGAKASIFANLMTKAMTYYNELPECSLKDLCTSAKKAKMTAQIFEQKRGSKETLYMHGVNNILNLKLSNPYKVFTDIKTHKSDLQGMSQDTLEVIQKIQAYPGVDKKIIEKLPLSVTSFFSRETANQLNKDKVSVKTMLEILAGKNFWQANLDINSWKKGDIKYKMVNSGSASIKVIGSKASMDDIEAKQGTVNYELTLP